MRKRTAENLMMLLLCFSFVFLFRDSTVNAARMEEAEEYELGTVFQGKLTFDEGVRYFRFVIPERSRVTLYLERSGKGCEGAVYNKTGSEMIKKPIWNIRQIISQAGLPQACQGFLFRVLIIWKSGIMENGAGRNINFLFAFRRKKR